MTTLREDVAALSRRVAQEFKKIREEIGDIEGGTGGEGGSSGPCTADNTSYGSYGYESVADALDDLLYKPVAINSFTNSANTKEMGITVDSVTLNWSINKTPATLTLNGEALDVTRTTTTLNGLGLTSNKGWTLAATDERDAKSTKTTSVTFLNGVYYGVGKVNAEGVTSSFILGLTKTLASTRAKTFDVNPAKGEYIYYAIPTRFGTPKFEVGGFEGGFDLLTTINFTNSSGFQESYSVYRSTNSGLGSTKVVVS